MSPIELIIIYYAVIFVAVGIIGTLIIALTDEIFRLDDVLLNKKDFVKCIFMYQVAIKMLLEYDINTAGILILEILTTLSVWFLNIIVFAILVVCLILKGIGYGFWPIFRKKEGE